MKARRGVHTVYRLAYHFVWIPWYRRKVLTGDVAQRLEELIREICAGRDWEDVLTILRLRKEKVAAQLTQDEKLDVIALLTRLTGRELPGNVARELGEWAEHAVKFVLYDGFALLEGDEDLLATDPSISETTVERISPTIHIIHSPAALFARLEEAQLMPLKIEHSASALRPLPPGTRTVFARESQVEPAPQERKKVPATLRRHTTIMLHFPDGELLEKFRQAALDIRCPVEVDKRNRTATFSKRYESQVAQALQTLEEEHVIHIEGTSNEHICRPAPRRMALVTRNLCLL